jgi:hydroxypyruvate reductase
VIALISGGGSSLLVSPAQGLTLADKQAVNAELLRCGATIAEMNCVRRHLSGIKGGRLAAACHPAKVVTLLISDVPGDDPIDIASGPTVADPTTCSDALAIVDRHDLNVSPAVRALLASGEGETVKPGDPRLTRTETRMITAPQIALEAAARIAHDAGITPYILGDSLEGEARDLGKALAGIARQVAKRGQPFKAPCVLLSGGETTVTLKGRDAVVETSSSCCRSVSRSMDCPRSTRSQATPTASTAPRRSPARSSHPIHSRVRGPGDPSPRQPR